MRLSNFRTPSGALLNIYIDKKSNTVKTNLFGKLEVVNDVNTATALTTVVKNASSCLVYVDPNNTAIQSLAILQDCESLLNDILKSNGINQVVTINPNVVAATKRPKPAPSQDVNNQDVNNTDVNTQDVKEEITTPIKQEKINLKTLNQLNNFFSEFNIDVAKSNRFINSICNKSKTSPEEVVKYISGYVDLIDHPEKDSIVAKLLTPEFNSIIDNLNKIDLSKIINKRISILYGPAGTGKTTKAIQQYPGAAIINCNPDITCQDLFETFNFVNGQPVFEKSDFIKAMEEGLPIILDEINLLNYDVIRTLQTLTDNKTTFNYKGTSYNIKDGFKIIGTMNLIVNGRIYPLSEPLVDRCSDIEMLTLSDIELVSRAF